jgi:bifunctional enzyme CysN/CysC
MIDGQNIQWQRPYIDRATRWRVLGLSGATVWLTGLPAAGKSTIAGLVERRLVEGGIAAYRLDGDNIRHGLSGDLGFGAEDRSENVRRTAHAARLLADAGVVVLVGLVSPYAADRRQARELHERNDLPFFEVYVSTPLAVCEQRDPKRLYERARRGEIPNMTGVDDPYEPPETPELVVTPGPIEEQVAAVLTLLHRGAY